MVNFKDYELLAQKIKAIAHPHRLCIIKGLMENSCNVTNIQNCMNLPQSTISQHLAKLKSAGIIKGNRKGVQICYEVVDKDVIRVLKALNIEEYIDKQD